MTSSPSSTSPSSPEKSPPETEDTCSAECDAPWRPFIEGLRKFIAQRVPSNHVDDVLQDTLLQLHEAASSLDEVDRPEAWTFTIARRTIADFYRDEERRPVGGPFGSADDVADEVADPSKNVAEYDGDHDVHEEVLSWLRPMAEELPSMYARALIMADFEGYTQQEVADELGLTLSGAKSRVQRARTKLGELLQDCCEVEFGPEGQAVAFRRLNADDED